MSDPRPLSWRRRLAIDGLGVLFFCLPFVAYCAFDYYEIRTCEAPAAGVADCATLLGAATRKTKPPPTSAIAFHTPSSATTGATLLTSHSPARRSPQTTCVSMGSLTRPLSKNPAPASPSKTSILARELATERGILDFIIIRDPMQLPRGMVMAKHLNMKARPCTGPSISESSKIGNTRAREPRTTDPPKSIQNHISHLA